MGSSSDLSDFTDRQDGEEGERQKRVECDRNGEFVVLSRTSYFPITFSPRQLCSDGSHGMKICHPDGFSDNLVSLVQH